LETFDQNDTYREKETQKGQGSKPIPGLESRGVKDERSRGSTGKLTGPSSPRTLKHVGQLVWVSKRVRGNLRARSEEQGCPRGGGNRSRRRHG